MKKLWLFVVLFAMAVSLQADPAACVDPGQTLLTTLGTVGCTSGDKVFSNFWTNSGSAIEVAFSNIADTSHWINFRPVIGNFASDFVVAYRIAMGDTAVPNWGIIGVQIDSNVPGCQAPCPDVRVDKFLTYAGGSSLLTSLNGATDSLSGLQTRWIDVSIAVTVPTGRAMSGFSDTYFQGQIPEPVTMALFGSGLLALGLVRRFRRRS